MPANLELLNDMPTKEDVMQSMSDEGEWDSITISFTLNFPDTTYLYSFQYIFGSGIVLEMVMHRLMQLKA